MYKCYCLQIKGAHFNAELMRFILSETLVEWFADGENQHEMNLYHSQQYSLSMTDREYDDVFIDFIRKNIFSLKQNGAEEINLLVTMYEMNDDYAEVLSPEIYYFLGQQQVKIKIRCHTEAQ